MTQLPALSQRRAATAIIHQQSTSPSHFTATADSIVNNHHTAGRRQSSHPPRLRLPHCGISYERTGTEVLLTSLDSRLTIESSRVSASEAPLAHRIEDSSSVTHIGTKSTMSSSLSSGKQSVPKPATEGPLTAARKVLQTPKLLRLIFAKVPVRDLLLSQRTSKTLRNTIRGSQILQRQLYLRSSGASIEQISINPLLDADSVRRASQLGRSERLFKYGEHYYALGPVK